MVKSKKSNLAKFKKPNFEKDNFGTDFLTLEAKKAFIHLQKAFTKGLILHYFEPKCYIRIKINSSDYTIGEILSQLTSDQPFSNHMTNENLDPISAKTSKIGK